MVVHQKDTECFAEIQKVKHLAPEKAGSRACLLISAAVVYNFTLVFHHEWNLFVFFMFSVFLTATNLLFYPLPGGKHGLFHLLVTRLEL